MYFDPATKAPMTLLELGLFAVRASSSCVAPVVFGEKGTSILPAIDTESSK